MTEKTTGVRKNKSIEAITGIEMAIQQECADLSMADDNDRAQMSIWIYNNFCLGDYRENLHKRILRGESGPSRELGSLPGKEIIKP